MDERELNELWDIYLKNREKGNAYLYRNRLTEHYSYLNEIIAKDLKKELPKYIELDDLIAYGVFGLMDSIEKYIPSMGNRFETYAVCRIRGTMINKLRKIDWVPQDVRLRTLQLKKAYETLEKILSRKPDYEEVIEELSKDAYPADPFNHKKPRWKAKGRKKAEMIFNSSANKMSYLEDISLMKMPDKNKGYKSSKNDIKCAKTKSPLFNSEKKDLCEFLKKNLTREEILILTLRYSNYSCSNTIRHSEREKRWRGVSWESIGKIIGNLTGGAIRIKHKEILEKLKSRMQGKGLDLEYCLENL